MVSNTPSAGISPGRVDFEREREFDRVDYSLPEALENFRRIATKHNWTEAEDAHREAVRASAGSGSGAGAGSEPSADAPPAVPSEWGALTEELLTLAGDAPSTFT